MRTQTFGIEIEMNRISRAKAARIIADHFGTTATGSRRWEIPDAQGRIWRIVPDRSIAGPDNEATELVSPICTREDIETVQELARKLRRAGANPDESCGIHIHIGRGNHTAKTLRNLANIVAAKEGLLKEALKVSDWRFERYCKPADQQVLKLLNKARPKTDEAFARLWYQDENWEARASSRYDNTRYHMLNLHSTFEKGTVEFRFFNSTLHAGEIKSYIQLCMAISHRALESKSASPKPPTTTNQKYTFRCWLLQLGFIGDEFKTARHHLLKDLKGDSAFRGGRP